MGVELFRRGRRLAVGLGVLMCAGACAPSRSTPAVTSSGERPTAAATAAAPGIWTGEWVRQDCREKGGAVGLACKNVPPRQQLKLRLAREADGLTGELELGTLRTQVAGSQAANGTVRLTGRDRSDEQTLELREWRATVRGHTMEGTFLLEITPANQDLGVVTLTARLDGVTRADR